MTIVGNNIRESPKDGIKIEDNHPSFTARNSHRRVPVRLMGGWQEILLGRVQLQSVAKVDPN
jgi:hypothetical protein